MPTQVLNRRYVAMWALVRLLEKLFGQQWSLEVKSPIADIARYLADAHASAVRVRVIRGV